MSVQYGVVLNKLTQPHSYMCQTVGRDTVEEKELAGFIHDKHPTITQKMAQTVLDAFGAITYEELLKGNGVTLTNFMRFDLTIRGKMKLPTDLISKSRINVNAIPAKEFQDDFRFLADIGPRIPIPLIKLPVITTMRDSNSALPNWFRANHPMIVDGENLGIDRNDTDQGLFLTSPAGNTAKASLQLIGNKQLIGIPTLDTAPQPAGTNSVAYTVQAKAKYTPDGDLRSSNIYGYARTTNKVDESNPYVYVDGNASTSPATASYAGDESTIKLIATYRTDSVLRVSAGLLDGIQGYEVNITTEATYNITVPDAADPVILVVSDRTQLISTLLNHQRYLMEVLEIGASTPPAPVFDEIDYKVPSDSLSVTFGDVNPIGRYFGSVAGGWYTASSRRPVGDFKYTQIYVGQNYETESQVAMSGSVLEEEVGGSLSLNTYGVISIGNNTIYRRLGGTVSGNEWVTPAGFGTWSLNTQTGAATLLAQNRSVYGPYGDLEPTPNGHWDCQVYSNGILYFHAERKLGEIGARLGRVTISNTTGLVSGSISTITGTLGIDNLVWYNPSSTSGKFGNMTGKAIDAGGAIWAIRKADDNAVTNPGLVFFSVSGGSTNLTQCTDLDGCPLAMATKGSVFATCYLTALHSEVEWSEPPQGLIRIRCGTLDGIIPTYGASIDLYAGLNTFGPVPADMIHLGGEYYILVIGNMDGGTTDFFLLKTDGSTITVENTMTMGATRWYQPIMLAPSGYSDYVLCHVQGSTGSTNFPNQNQRYVFPVGDFKEIPMIEGANTSTVKGEASIDRALTVPAGLASMTITITSATGVIDLVARQGARPTLWSDYDYNLYNYGTPYLEEIVAAPTAGLWYFTTISYEAVDVDAVITITFTP